MTALIATKWDTTTVSVSIAVTAATTPISVCRVARRRASAHAPAIASRNQATRRPIGTPGGDGISATRGSTSGATPQRAASGAAVSWQRRSGLVRIGSGADAASGANRSASSAACCAAEGVEAGIGVEVPAGGGPSVADQVDERHQAPSSSQPSRRPGSAPGSMYHSVPKTDGEHVLGHGEEHPDVGDLAGVGGERQALQRRVRD